VATKAVKCTGSELGSDGPRKTHESEDLPDERNVLEGRRSMKSASLLAISFCSFCLVACGDSAAEGGETGEDTLSIVGDYIDDFMTEHSITETQWSFAGSVFAIVEYDNDGMYIIAQNDEANEYFPGLWSRFDWTWDGEQLYYCQHVYDGMNIEDARASSADPNDLATGCGADGFSWSMLNPPTP
jgi:hypothetical protein